MRTVCVQRVSKALSFALCVGNTLCIRYQITTFSQSGLKLLFFLFFYECTVRRLCVTGTNLGQRKHDEFRACAVLVPNVELALVWRSSGVYIHTWKNAHIFEHAENVRRGCRTQKMNDVYRAFSSNHQRILRTPSESQRTPSESQRTDQNSSFFCALGVRDGMCD